ncbi:MAG: ABC transporter permease, partial [Thaumarchaeota archaeon]|nr:ABC transporter permease [Nitrososphaerota archaeon]
MPIWINNFMTTKLPEHQIIKEPDIVEMSEGGIRALSHKFVFDYNYDAFLNDFMLSYIAQYHTTSPLLQFSIERPDGNKIEMLRISLPMPQTGSYTHTGIIFSTDDAIKKSLREIISKFKCTIDESQPEIILFADVKECKVLKGTYKMTATFFLFDDRDNIIDSELLLGGKVYGLLGTDELRRDLAVGIVWGTPIALFIGISVSSMSVIIGLIYGTISGYRGRGTDEVMMRANDVVYALPALPILILLAVTVGKSIFLIVGYLIIFGWVAIAKVSRSMALQIKNLQYIEAAQLMGQSSTRIIFKHILPQLLPYAFAIIAISVPAAIITEAGLSFLGLGDPTLPTWGQILHDAHVSGAAARGLWWWIVPPGVMIAITGLAFVLIGTALDSIVNPKMRKI